MSTTQNSDYCGGCGETDGNKRCIGRMHPISTAQIPSARTDELAAESPTPPFGTKRKAAMAIYSPPFSFMHGYIYDSKMNMVADQGGFGDKDTVERAVALQIRGWGRIGYMPNAKDLQDEVGAMCVDALNAYYATHAEPEPPAPPPARQVNCPNTDRKTNEIMLERGYQLTGYVLRHPETQHRAIIESSAVRWVKADDMAKIMFPQNRQPREKLTDERIDEIAISMPGGLDGFLKGWGWRQFARAIEAENNKATT